MNPDLELVRTFLAAADELHFARAADRRHLDPSGISRQIRLLEQRLGVSLFDRSTRRVQLTASGIALLPAARELVRGADEFEAHARIEANRHRDELRVGLMTHAAGPELVAALSETARSMSLRLTISEAEFGDTDAGVRSGRTDLGIVFGPFDDRDLVTLPLRQLPRVAAISVHHRLAGRTELTLDDLVDEPWIAPPENDRIFHDFWMAVDERRGRPVRIGARCRTAEEGLLAATTGAGVAIGATSRPGFSFDGIAIVPIADLRPCTVAIAHRATGADPRAVEMARRLADRLAPAPGRRTAEAVI
jgi:DNA-binding transcriptional LysR family regulator